MRKNLFTKKNFIIGLITLFFIILFVINMQLNNLYDTPENTLLKFYNELYISCDIENMKSCLIDSYQYYFENAVTMAGMEPEYYKTYHEDAVKLLGNNFTIKIEINDQKPVDNVIMEQLKKHDTRIFTANKVHYKIIFSVGDMQKIYDNSMDMVKIKGRWYMTTHLNLPIGTNIYAY